jgi:hypothetical protein
VDNALYGGGSLLFVDMAAMRPANDPILELLRSRGFVPASEFKYRAIDNRGPSELDDLRKIHVRPKPKLGKGGRSLPKLGSSLPPEMLDPAGRRRTAAARAKAIEDARLAREEEIDERLNELMADVQGEASRRCALKQKRLDILGIFDVQTNQLRADSITRAALRKKVSTEELRAQAVQQVAAGKPRPRTASSRAQLSVSEKLLQQLDQLDGSLVASEAKAAATTASAPRAGRRSRRRDAAEHDGGGGGTSAVERRAFGHSAKEDRSAATGPWHATGREKPALTKSASVPSKLLARLAV